MTPIAPHIEAFLRERLPVERGASEHTTSSYSTAFQLLFEFASERLKVPPSQLQLEQIDAPVVLDFLVHLETTRGNRASTRNVRLAAIKSFMRFVEHRVPSALEQIRRILAIPAKKTDERLPIHLTVEETEAVVKVPDPTTRDGIRDRAMLYLGFYAGLRVSELVGLCVDDLSLGSKPIILVRGKGRRQRALPLDTQTSKALRAWLAIRGEAPVPELFLNARGVNMTRSGFEYILSKHVDSATKTCHTLVGKRVSPHTLRHTCAVITLQATGDIRKVSLWLGHANSQTTDIYTRIDPVEFLDISKAVILPNLRRGRFQPRDRLLAFLKQRSLCGAQNRPGGDCQRTL